MDHVFNNAPDLTDLKDDFMTTSLFNKEEGSNLSELKESIAQQTSLAQSFLRYYFKLFFLYLIRQRELLKVFPNFY